MTVISDIVVGMFHLVIIVRLKFINLIQLILLKDRECYLGYFDHYQKYG
jgi:hypothetical protein